MKMDRASLLALYRPIRASIQRVLRLAPTACKPADLIRSAKNVLGWTLPDEMPEGEAFEMIMDVALFEPNQIGRRAYDRFLAQKAHELDAADQALAQSMAQAWFSIFRVAGRRETAGLWLEDLLDGDRRLWLMDEGLEASAIDGVVIGMRLFDAGPFHAGFGITVSPDEMMTNIAVTAIARDNRLPFRQSLATTLYGDQLRAEQPLDLEEIPLIEGLLQVMLTRSSRPEVSAPPRPRSRKRVRASKRS